MRKALKSLKVKVKVKFTLQQAKQGYKYSSTLSLTSAVDRGGLSTPPSGRFTRWETDPVSITGGWVGLRVGLDRCGKSRPHRDSIHEPSSP